MAERRRARATTADPAGWYSEGLRFSCQPGCGACCTNHGDYAYIYLEGGDLERIAAFSGLTPAKFKRRFTTTDDGHRILRMDDQDCPFLAGSRCTIYAVRPTQCRTFPFWKENLDTPESWERLRRFCPGIDRGRRHSLLTIGRRLAARGIE